ncbi:hypothetical protein NBE98_09630 [Clostridium swellfunianum]|uniref:hypothetical protein n=1 Tax=Clostridium swellfunianum TaxID=1367462 RepID=UPI00202E795C|nr:hypothetical protein [Clostridium swellfunianum]MCM0648633.1 hypothetical protein [Clostridium swellfunianum]
MTRIYDYLNSKGIDVYFIGQHQGECDNPYVVLKDDGTVGQNDSNKIGAQTVDIIFFIPQNQFTKSISYKKQVKGYLKELNFIRYTGVESGAVTDDEKKAITFSVMYEILKKLEG